MEVPVRIVTPGQAVTEAIQIAAPRQAGLAPLFADLEQIAKAPNAAASPIPMPVRQAASDVLSLRVPLDEHLAGADLKQAFVRSGVLFEPRLAAARPVPADARAVQEPAQLSVSSHAPPHATEVRTTPLPDGLKAVPAPRDDLKGALLVFRQVLKAWRVSLPTATTSENPKAPLPAGSQRATQPPMQAQAPAVASDLETIRHVASALAGLPDDLPQRAPLSPEQASSLAKSLAAALMGRDGTVPPGGPIANAVAPSYPGAPLAVSSGLETIRHVANALAGLPDDLPQGALLSPEQASSLAKSLAAALMGRDAPVAQAGQTPNAVAPPYRGAPLAVQAIAAPTIAPDAAPHEIAHKLIAETDGALARQTLLQVASLPEQPGHPRAEAAQRWSFEVPFATPQGTAIAQFEVSRDGSPAKADPQARTWRARFTLDVEPMGPVHAMIALAGARTSVTLWAERASTATRLNEHAPLLSEALRAAELEPADVQFRVGAPPAIARQAAPGRFMDRAS